jgi:hypothetical protein
VPPRKKIEVKKKKPKPRPNQNKQPKPNTENLALTIGHIERYRVQRKRVTLRNKSLVCQQLALLRSYIGGERQAPFLLF